MYSVLPMLILRYWLKHQIKDTEKASVYTILDHREAQAHVLESGAIGI